MKRREGKLIIDNLYLGTGLAASNPEWVDKENIKFVLNVARDVPVSPLVPRENCLKISMSDSLDQDIRPHLEECFQFLISRTSSDRVLVHCREGLSRYHSSNIHFIYLN